MITCIDRIVLDIKYLLPEGTVQPVIGFERVVAIENTAV